MKDIIKIYILSGIIALVFLVTTSVLAAPTTTIVQNLRITDIATGGSPCLVISATGLISTATCGTGGGGGTTTINGLQPANGIFSFVGAGNTTVATTSPNIITISSTGGSGTFTTSTLAGLQDIIWLLQGAGGISISTSTSPSTITITNTKPNNNTTTTINGMSGAITGLNIYNTTTTLVNGTAISISQNGAQWTINNTAPNYNTTTSLNGLTGAITGLNLFNTSTTINGVAGAFTGLNLFNATTSLNFFSGTNASSGLVVSGKALFLGLGGNAAQTCGGTDKVSSISATGTIVCTTDALGEPGGGITSLNGITDASQTFTTSTDTNLGIRILSSGTTHNFLPIWIGTLANDRIASSSYWSVKQDALGFNPQPAFTSVPYASTTGVQNTLSWPLGYASSTHVTILGSTYLGALTSNGTTTLTNNGVQSLTAGGGVTVSSATGTITLGTTGLQGTITFPLAYGSTTHIGFPIPYASTTGIQNTLSFPLAFASTTHINLGGATEQNISLIQGSNITIATTTASITISANTGSGAESGWRYNSPYVYNSTSTDSVVIGNTSTTAKFAVYNNAATSTLLIYGTTSTPACHQNKDSDGTGWTYSWTSGGYMYIDTAKPSWCNL